jgi:hypothetical protein
LKEAGMEVVETENYYQRLNGHAMAVSLWEGHPNEESHAIFASMFEKKLKSHPTLQRFKKRQS